MRISFSWQPAQDQLWADNNNYGNLIFDLPWKSCLIWWETTFDYIKLIVFLFARALSLFHWSDQQAISGRYLYIDLTQIGCFTFSLFIIALTLKTKEFMLSVIFGNDGRRFRLCIVNQRANYGNVARMSPIHFVTDIVYQSLCANFGLIDFWLLTSHRIKNSWFCWIMFFHFNKSFHFNLHSELCSFLAKDRLFQPSAAV